MPNSEISQETRNKQEIARSKVRRVVTYTFAGVLSFVLLYGVVWMGDRSAFTATVSIGTSVISYWFGSRSAKSTT